MTEAAGKGDGTWVVTAELKPSGAESHPAKATVSPAESTSPPWKEAAADLRTTVKWMVTAFAVVGGVMFAKGFVTTPNLSWSDDWPQLIGALLAGAVGLLAIGWLISLAVDAIRPTLFELATMPQAFKDEFDKQPEFFYPDDARTFDEFVTKYRAWTQLVDDQNTEVGRAEGAVAEAEAKAQPHLDSVATAKVQLRDLEEADQPDQGRIDAAREQLRQLEEAARAVQEQLRGARSELKYAEIARGRAELALARYRAARTNLLDRAGYWAASGPTQFKKGRMVTAAFLAAFGGIGYQLLLAEPAESTDSTKPATPVIGELVRSEAPAGQELWRQLRLGDCQADPDSPRVSVVVASGKGTDVDPYVVSTLPTERCAASTFTVINDVARVNVPSTTVIQYTPSPTASEAS